MSSRENKKVCEISNVKGFGKKIMIVLFAKWKNFFFLKGRHL